ncbi:unnamed protein product [Echinostoma caproni]|uniref:AAA_6 domain-containing protein n=1 Tax=Echinostoma caproni TaxID=27848 RepID=A0A183AME2_9TREM|nr:unnamed protein product [Echinostoma caproni]
MQCMAYPGVINPVADALSRMLLLGNPYPEAVDLQDIATVLTGDIDIERLRKESTLLFEHPPLPSSEHKVY